MIPAIDLKNGHCVRLFKGDFERTTEYSSNPVEIAKQFSQLAVDDLHVVDLDGALTGTQHNRLPVMEIAQQSGLTVQLGGGIRSREDIASWLSSGVTRCVLGSVAINQPKKVTAWLGEFGGAAMVLALDVKLDPDATPWLTTDGWTKDSATTLWEALDTYAKVGVRHVLCTDVARDGAMTGPNLGLYAEIMRRYPALLLQASGGVRNVGDLDNLRAAGIPAAITGRALLDGAITAAEVASFRQSA